MLDKRKEIILKTLIKEHIKSGSPVGSSILVDKYKLDISPATVRNEMAELEEAGFIKQPYTSAGRVPTEKAYRFYLSDLEEKGLHADEEKILKTILNEWDESSFKHAAKAVAKFSGNAVFWAFHRRDLYYTGISNLIAQPEFMQNDLIYDISMIIDRMDEIIEKNFEKIEFGMHVFLGSENPFSRHCSSVIVKYKKDGNAGMVGVLGPMRMNYEKNIALIKFLEDKLN